MSFRKPYILTREIPGYYLEGEWVPGIASSVPIRASIQPVTGEDQITVPEGRRLVDFIKVYTSTKVFTAAEATGQTSDKIVWQGDIYEAVQVDVRQMDVIPHYKAIFSRVVQ